MRKPKFYKSADAKLRAEWMADLAVVRGLPLTVIARRFRCRLSTVKAAIRQVKAGYKLRPEVLKPNPLLIHNIERLLFRARSGELQGLLTLAYEPDGNRFREQFHREFSDMYAATVRRGDIIELIGHLETAARDLHLSVMEDYSDATRWELRSGRKKWSFVPKKRKRA